MNSIICFISIILDRIIGDPKGIPHPVIWIGKLIASLEKKLNSGAYRKLKGGLTVVITILLTFIVVWTICSISYHIHILLGIIVEIILVSFSLAQKSLKEAAMAVFHALETQDITKAREKLGQIVGRDTDTLDEPEIVRGVVETVSENTSDGVTAPLFYALLFGATGAWVYKAINTLDSMIGYKNERYGQFGFFAAKLDDVANLLPSRITGLLMVLFTKNETSQSIRYRLKGWIRDAKKHPSPNSGYLEAATAYQLGIRLGGWNSYGGVKSFREYMGEERVTLGKQHIIKSLHHLDLVTIYFFIIIVAMQTLITIL